MAWKVHPQLLQVPSGRGALQGEKWKLHSISSTYQVDCNNRALWVANLGGWLQGNLFGCYVPRESEKPKNQSQQKAIGLCGRSRGNAVIPLAPAPGPGKARPSCQGTASCLKRSCELEEARTQILAGQAPQPGHMPATEKLNERALHLSSYHLHIQMSVSLTGRLCL